MMLFEKISNRIALSISNTLNADNDKEEVIAYGAYIMLDTILAISMVIIFGVLFRVLPQALVVSFSSALLRKTSGGAHATTSIRCATIGTLTSVGFALIIKSLSAFITYPTTVIYFLITFIISYIIIVKLAPKDSPNKPIVKEDKIKELKLKSIKILRLYALICIIVLFYSIHIKNQSLLLYIYLICTGYLWQSITLTSLGHFLTSVLEKPFGYINFTGGESK